MLLLRCMGRLLAHRDISLRCRIWSLSGHTDALKLTQAAGASAAGRYPGRASQRTFLLDDATRRGIAAALKGR
jgi:hypothetical protein